MNPQNGRNDYPGSRSLKNLGKIIKALNALHPALGRAAVSRLFFMPFSRAPSAAAQRTLSEAEHLLLPFRNRYLAAYSWGSGPTILLLHGWGANAGTLRVLIEPLTSAGFRVLAIDAPAHGESPGKMTNLVDYGEAIEAAVARYGPVRALFAHSFGAMAALLLLAEKPGLAVGAAIVNNPPAGARDLVDMFAGMLHLPDDLKSSLVAHIETQFGKPLEYFSLPFHAGSLTLPGMLIADPNDPLTRFETLKTIAKQWKGVRLLVTDGLGHHGALRDAVVVQEVLTFIDALEGSD